MTAPPNAPDPAAPPAAAEAAEQLAGSRDRDRIEAPYYPIVYVRGYAMTGGERDETFHDGYYGFAASSVRKRQGPPDEDRYLVPEVFEGLAGRFVIHARPWQNPQVVPAYPA